MDLDQIYDDIIQFGYNGKAKEKEAFCNAFHEGLPNLLYIDIAQWICSLLGRFRNLENCITVSSDGINSESQITFLAEMSEILKELNCPMKRFITGQMGDRLFSILDKKEILRFLCSEIQAAKISAYKKTKKEQASMQIELGESKTAKELKEMLISLSFGRPPDTITTQMLFGEVVKKIKQLCHPQTPKEFVGDLLFSGCLTEKQWFQLEDLCKEMAREYKTRRRLLITRLEVTIQSFLWADRLKGKTNEIMTVYQGRKGELLEESNVKISDILAASFDLAEIEKTSSGSVRRNTKCKINKVIIGAVPDRGGRPEEQQPPPPEVPAWQKSQPQQGRGGSFSSGDKSGGFSRQSDQGRQNWQQGQDRQSKYDDQQRYSNHRNDGGRSGELGNYNRSGPGRQQQSSHMSNYNAQNYISPTGGENYNPMYAPDPRNFHPQMMQHVPQFGFGGFAPAGDNFSQYGSYQSQSTGVDNSRQRGGGGGGRYQRGNRRGRGRY